MLLSTEMTTVGVKLMVLYILTSGHCLLDHLATQAQALTHNELETFGGCICIASRVMTVRVLEQHANKYHKALNGVTKVYVSGYSRAS